MKNKCVYIDSHSGEWRGPHLQQELGGQHDQVPRHHRQDPQGPERLGHILCHRLRGCRLERREETDPAIPSSQPQEEEGEF